MSRSNTIALIVPSEAYRIDDFVEATSRLGVGLAVATEAHHGLAEDMGAHIIPIDFNNPTDAAARIAGSSLDLSAILSIDDRGVTIAAEASRLRGLPHNSPQAAAATRDKSLARQMLDGVVPQPAFSLVEDDNRTDAATRNLRFPVVVKPVGLAGSIGVIRVESPDQVADTVTRVRSIQAQHGFPNHHPLLIEEFVGGGEVAVEALISDGNWTTLTVFDKPDPLDGPFFPETHYVTPSQLDAATIAATEQAASRAAAHLGIVHGPVHAEFRVPEADEPVLIELAARPIGGLCGRALRFGLADTSLEELIVRNAIGEEVRGTRLAPGASGVSMIPVPRSGIFDGIAGVEEASRLTNITDIEVGRMIGTDVKPLPEASTYLGFVFARAASSGEVEHALRSAVGRLQVLIS